MNDEAKLPGSVGTIPEALAFWAERDPDAPAFVIPGKPEITCAELWRRTATMATTLRRHGAGRNDRVVLLLPEGPALALALLGAASATIAIPLSSTLTASELARALRGFGAASAIVPSSVDEPTRAYLAQSGVVVFAFTGDSRATIARVDQGPRAARAGETPQPEDIAFVVQTSGTTGLPKRVPRTHGLIIRDSLQHQDRFGLRRDDRAVAVAPLTLSLGLTTLLHNIVAGSALIFPPSTEPGPLLSTVEDERATWMFAPAGYVELLARFLRDSPRRQPSASLRLVRVTAAPIAQATCDEVGQRLGTLVLPSYSSSEVGLIATAQPPPAPHKPGSCGRPSQEIRIVDDALRDVPAGDEGEICVRGPKVFEGYLDDPDTNEATFMPGGWFRTGDVGYLDQDGFLFLTGRRNELINRGGSKIAPAEVDAILLQHPAVSDASAFAVTDPRLGQDIVAAVVLKQEKGVTARALRRWMLDRLEPYKTPRRIWFVDDLPRTATGKVQRHELARRWREDRA